MTVKLTMKVVAERATARVWDQSRKEGHCGQGLLLNLGGQEDKVVLTCHHVVAPVERENLRVMVPRVDGRLGEPLPVRYDEERSRPELDAVVLRLEGEVRPDERPLLHKLNLDTYHGWLRATGITYRKSLPDNFDAWVAASKPLEIPVKIPGHWPNPPECYRPRAFRLSMTTDARQGISGGVVLCEDGVLGLVEAARAEGDRFAREDYLLPLTVWAEGWPALERLIDPLIDENLRNAATVKRARELGVKRQVGAKRDNQLEIGGSVIAHFQEDLYIERGIEDQGKAALRQHGGLVIVGRPHSGKTRLAWQLLRDWPEALVVAPDFRHEVPPEFESSGFAGHEAILFLDDLHSTAQTMATREWRRRFEEASGQSCLVVCTSRDGKNLNTVREEQRLLLRDLGPNTVLFTGRVSEEGEEKGQDFSREQAWRLAEVLGVSKEFNDRFRGTPGSLLLDFDDMTQRYKDLRSEELGGVLMSRLLDSAKLLKEAFQPSLCAAILRAVAEEIRGDGRMSNETWEALRRRTQEEGFGRFDDTKNFLIYQPYLELCVAYNPWEEPEDIKQLVPILSRDEDAEGLLHLGVAYYHKSSYEYALDCFDQAIGLRPSYVEALDNKGNTLVELGRYEEALTFYDEAINLKPEYPGAQYNKGVALGKLRRYEKAIEAYDEALSLESHPDYWFNKGNDLNRLGRYDEALGAYDEATALDPGYVEAWNSKGTALYMLRRYSEALEAHNHALKLKPEYPRAWYNKGNTLIALGRYGEAVEWLCRAWRAREQLPARGVLLVQKHLRELGKTPETCE